MGGHIPAKTDRYAQDTDVIIIIIIIIIIIMSFVGEVRWPDWVASGGHRNEH